MPPETFRCGHPNTPENTRKTQPGRCLACHRSRNAGRSSIPKRKPYLPTWELRSEVLRLAQQEKPS